MRYVPYTGHMTLAEIKYVRIFIRLMESFYGNDFEKQM